jgi:hypothetical protein
MTLDAQLTQLVTQAPQYGVSPVVMERGILPVLRALAEPLQFEEYFILQSPQGQWVITTLEARSDANVQKNVIYGFGTDAIAHQFLNATEKAAIITSIPVTHFIFQLLALKPVDSLIFYEQLDSTEQVKEIKRVDFQGAIQKSLQQFRTSFA